MEEPGSIGFVINHETADWSTDNKGYTWGPFETGIYKFGAMKQPDRTLRVDLWMPDHNPYGFIVSMPPSGPRGVSVTLLWSEPEGVRLRLDEVMVESLPFSKL